MNPHDYRIKLEPEELELIRNLKPNNILEVFSGDGRNLDFFSAEGYDITGLNPEKNREIVIEHPIFGCRFPFDDESFDLVYSYQYINHGHKDEIIDVFKEIFRVLRKRGVFSLKISDVGQYNLKHLHDDVYEEQDLEFGEMKYRKIAEQTFVKMSGDEEGIPHYAFQKDELAETMENLGFATNNIRTIRWNIVGNFRR